MLKFTLFGYPVRIQWMFWILCAFLGMQYLKIPGRDGLIAFLIVSAVVLVSILWHELGHAWARKRSGQPYSEITLYGMGGLCGGPGQFTRKQSMFISAMGPAASLSLGVATLALFLFPAISPRTIWGFNHLDPGGINFVGVFVYWMLFANIGWGIMNLLPILPLDGGRIFEGFMANRNPSVAPKVGMVLAGVIAMLGLVSGQIFIAVLFGFLAYQNYQRVAHRPPQRF